jgi:uncharacterized protein (DUF983 family)
MDHSAGTRPKWPAVKRGARLRCPSCGIGPAFRAYLTQVDRCQSCGTTLGDIRADDFPPYATIFIVCHLMAPLFFYAERTYHPPLWLSMTLWPGFALVLCLVLLPHIKGAILGLMWSIRLKGDEYQ